MWSVIPLLAHSGPQGTSPKASWEECWSRGENGQIKYFIVYKYSDNSLEMFLKFIEKVRQNTRTHSPENILPKLYNKILHVVSLPNIQCAWSHLSNEVEELDMHFLHKREKEARSWLYWIFSNFYSSCTIQYNPAVDWYFFWFRVGRP